MHLTHKIILCANVIKSRSRVDTRSMTRHLPTKILCPVCGVEESRVIETRPSAAYPGSIRRRRVCSECDHRYTTIEFVETASDSKAPARAHTYRPRQFSTKMSSEEIDRRMKARMRLSHAIARGEVQRAPCEKCSATVSEAHHSDYDHPLQVTWLCKKCHSARHREMRYM
jgi:transcriptional regulator NrdR family protein